MTTTMYKFGFAAKVVGVLAVLCGAFGPGLMMAAMGQSLCWLERDAMEAAGE